MLLGWNSVTSLMIPISKDVIELSPNNMNMEDGFYLSKSWESLTCSLKDHRKPSPSHNSLVRVSMGPCRSQSHYHWHPWTISLSFLCPPLTAVLAPLIFNLTPRTPRPSHTHTTSLPVSSALPTSHAYDFSSLCSHILTNSPFHSFIHLLTFHRIVTRFTQPIDIEIVKL
jgi:hypothetical protein